ncbi:MAG TPA: hypothetical protein VGK74_14430 [Symbiobacteriaceae bacterium]
MRRENGPKVRITILPSVYDPERYRRGIAVLHSAFTRAVAEHLRVAPKRPGPE